MAAKKWSNYISKAVYCIDNIHFSTKIDELKDFITNKLSVKVISLFEVKPRRSAWQNSNYHADHSTFRLCIPKDDNHKLLQPDVWPEDIMISTWFRVKKKTETETNQHQPSDTDATDMEDNVPTLRYRNAATRHPGSTSSTALLQAHALSLPVSAGMDVLHSSSSGVPSSIALPTNSVVTPPSESSSGASFTVAVRQQSPVTKSVVWVCDLQSPTAVHSDYQASWTLISTIL